MSIFFTFEHLIERKDKNYRFLIMLKTSYNYSNSALTDALRDAEESSNKFDGIAIMVSEKEVNTFDEKKAEIINIINKDEKVETKILIEFNTNNKFKIKMLGGKKFQLSKEEYQSIFDSGLSYLAIKNNVLQKSPPGKVFRLINGKLRKYFIRASNLAMNDSEYYFIALCLIQQINSKKVIECIYVDTVQLLSFIYKLYQIIRDSNTEKIIFPEIINFNSYEGVKDITFKNGVETLVLISASYYGDLPKKIAEEWKIGTENIITLLSFKNIEEESNVLFDLNKLNIPIEECNVNDDTPISIKGEDFFPQNMKTKEILIKLAHKPKVLSDIMEVFNETNFIFIKKNDKEIYIDKNNLIKNKKFTEWFERSIRNNGPYNISHLVHTDDKASAKLAQDAKKLYAEKKIKLVITKSKDVYKIAKNKIKGGVLVLSALVDETSELFSINRDLRVHGNEVMQTYILGLILTKSKDDFETLKANLIHRLPEFQNNFLWKWQISINMNKDRDSWSKEIEFLTKLNIKNQLILERINCINNNRYGISKNCFWKTVSNECLSLREGFAFWKAGYKETCPSKVYFTISSVLQNARDLNIMGAISLNSDVYCSVVISPDCFDRYNDGIIQACLLRSAKPSELNYSDSPELSKKMKEFIIKIIEHRKSNFGEAFPEFMLALSIKQLTLNSEDMNCIYEFLKKQPLDDFEFFKDSILNIKDI